MPLRFYTIGVYGSTEKSFFDKLLANKIDTFCDIRNRRGVRGSQYTYVNSKKLQRKLKDFNIQYFHIIDLSPSGQIRILQEKADKKAGVQRRKREQMSDVFRKAYIKYVLNKFDLEKFAGLLQQNKARRVVLFCVEQNPEACHRSIVAEQIKSKLRLPVKHL